MSKPVKLRTFKKLPFAVMAFRLESDINMMDVMEMVPGSGFNQNGMTIPTLEGNMLARFGDWVVKDIEGNWYPVKDRIFTRTYMEIDKCS